MASRQGYASGVLREQWSSGAPGDPTPVGYTTWDANGANPTTRALTQAETAALTAQDAAAATTANQTTLQAKAQQALSANATFQAIGSPTNAQIAAQVQLLTKECNGIIRLLLNALDSTAGT